MTKEKEEDKNDELKEKEKTKPNKSKDKILDESFKQAELLKKVHPEKIEKKKVVKKPFIKIGIIIAFIAIIAIIFLNFIPWMYINYETDYGSVEEYFSYNELINNQIESEDIIGLIESTCNNCSDNSNNYLGLTLNDFKNTPKLTFYNFIFLVLIGIIFTIIIITDRKRDFSEETMIIIHSVFSTFLLITGIIIMLLNIKFLGANLILEMNKPFIEFLGFNNVKIFFFMPYISILFSFILFIIGLTFIKINMRIAIKNFQMNKSKKVDIDYRSGSNI